MKLSAYLFLLFAIFGCGSSNKIKDGKTAFEYKKYHDAIVLLKEEYQKTQRIDEKGEKAYLVAESYIKINDYGKANEWFKISEGLDYGYKAQLGLAKTYKNLEMYDKAIVWYEKLVAISPGDSRIQREVFICKEAARWKSEYKDNSTLTAWNPSSYASKYSPAIFEGEFIVYTSDDETATGSDRYDWTGRKMSDLFLAPITNPENSIKFDAFINSTANDGTAIFTEDNNSIIFTRCMAETQGGNEYCKLMQADRVQGVWSEPRVLPFIKPGINYGQPALIENDSVLVFSSLSEDGSTGYDLWYSVLDADWTTPFAMPSSINTEGNEHFPTSDEDTLFFSSDYLPGMGGLDIFKTYLMPDGSWSEPVNLKLPYNSGADDFGLIKYRSKKNNTSIIDQGYLCSTRNMAGHEEIYRYEIYQSSDDPKEPEITSTEAEKTVTLYLAGKVVEKIFEVADDPNTKVIGKKSISSPFVKIVNEKGEEIKTSANNKGLFISNLDPRQKYFIAAKKVGYLNNEIELDPSIYAIPNDQDSYTINVEIVLDKIYKGKEIILDNIYYDLDKSFIREDAKPTLDELVQLLKRNPQIDIELLSHTDCRGEDDYNMKLSQARADAAVQYLYQNGIAIERLDAKGFGESRPVASCDCNLCNEDQHQMNRRTSFVIK